MKIERSVIIEKPVAEVFAYSQNNENYTKWQSGVVSMQMDEGPDNVVGILSESMEEVLRN